MHQKRELTVCKNNPDATRRTDRLQTEHAERSSAKVGIVVCVCSQKCPAARTGMLRTFVHTVAMRWVLCFAREVSRRNGTQDKCRELTDLHTVHAV